MTIGEKYTCNSYRLTKVKVKCTILIPCHIEMYIIPWLFNFAHSCNRQHCEHKPRSNYKCNEAVNRTKIVWYFHNSILPISVILRCFFICPHKMFCIIIVRNTTCIYIINTFVRIMFIFRFMRIKINFPPIV